MSSIELKCQIEELQEKLDLQLMEEKEKIKKLKSEIATFENDLTKKRAELEFLQGRITIKDDWASKYPYECDHFSRRMSDSDEHHNPSHTWTNGQSFYTCEKDYAC